MDTEVPSAHVEETAALMEDTGEAYAQAHGLSWTEVNPQRNREQRLPERRPKEAV